MIGASSQSGDTLIECHFPVVQLPTWQLPAQALCTSAKKPSRLCSVGLTRAISLPEQDSLNREYAFSGGKRHFSSSSLTEDRAEEEGTSDSSGRYDSTSSPEENSSQQKESCEGKGSLRSHNSFLPNTEKDEEDEDEEGDNLHRYHEDSSFVLHGNSNWPVSNSSKHFMGDVGGEWGNEGTMFGHGLNDDWLSNQPDQLHSLQTNCQCFPLSSGIVACGEQVSARLTDNMSCLIHSQHKCSPELFSNSDSSCNSSDGVLVNFCAIYKRSNNPATPQDLSSPAVEPSAEGSVFLNLRPVPQTPPDLKHHDISVRSPLKDDANPSWSPHGLDSNCNLYSMESMPPGLSSLEASDLTACLQTQAKLAISTNQKYYKLVTCDLSSQSPSPAWSSDTSCPEGQSRSGTPPRPETDRSQKATLKERGEQQKRFSSTPCSSGFDCSLFRANADDHLANTSTEKALYRKKHTESIQTVPHVACSLCPSQSSHSSRCQGMSSASTQPSVMLDQEQSSMDPSEQGACSLETPFVRYSKSQRPTSLPIQPFVLVPPGKTPSQAQHLGCLLEQYMNQKSNKAVSAQPSFTFKGKRSRCFSNLQLSPMGSQFPVFLEAPSSSDTCSTCSPSPECFSYRRTWSQSSRGQAHMSPSYSSLKPKLDQNKTSPHSGKNMLLVPNQCGLVKIPTYQNLIHLTPDPPSHRDTEPNKSPSHSQADSPYLSAFSHTPPTVTLTADTHQPNLQVSLTPPTPEHTQNNLPQYRASCVRDSGFFHSSFTAAISSIAPFSSLSSLFSLAASGLQIQDFTGVSGKQSQSQHSKSLILSDRPPTEFCLSPDTSYESMSISHLQRRGLLRAVSRAVDLIMAHFGSSRDPEEKMRLGNSYQSPTIAGLVLEHLCPAIQNILEDGLQDHKLDLIIGQRRNHSWKVVEISTRIGPYTRVLHSLVTKIRQCPQLSSHCMRLRAFIMGLLNLRSLEFWLSHLQSQKDIVTTHYHSWGFLSMSLGWCQPLFQELMLLLQPLSVLPFNLNLLLEPRMLRNRELRPEVVGACPPTPCSALLVTSWPLLQADRKTPNSSQTNSSLHIGPHCQRSQGPQGPRDLQQDRSKTNSNRSPLSAPPVGRWPQESALMDSVVEGEDCSHSYRDNWCQISIDSRQDERKEQRDTDVQLSPGQRGLRWAKLFGAADSSTSTDRVAQSRTGAQSSRYNKRPSQWLHLDRCQLGLLAQSIRSMTLGGAQTEKNTD